MLHDLSVSLSSFDRYRLSLKGTWKDEPRPAAGLIYDLGAHLIDQTLSLFGRPKVLTAFASNLRGIGHPDVDDNVCILDCILLMPDSHFRYI